MFSFRKESGDNLISVMLRSVKIQKVIIFFLSALVAFILAFPIFWMMSSALKHLPEMFVFPPTFIPEEMTLTNFKLLFMRTEFASYFRNSVVVALFTTLISASSASLGAYSITRFKYKGQNLIRYFILSIYMFPPILLAIPLFVFITKIGLSDTLTSLVIAHITFALPFSLWILLDFFKNIPEELEESAFIDGANRVQAFFFVVLPIALPGIVAVSVFAFIMSWNDYLFALIFISSETKKTIPLGLSHFMESAGTEWGLLMASG